MDYDNRNLERAAGCILIGCAIASVTALSVDRGATATETRELLQQLAALGPMRGALHALQMCCVTGYAFGFTVLSLKLGIRRGPVLAGLIAFLFGSVVMLVATVNDGFLTAAVAARFAAAPDMDLEIARDLIRFANMSVTYFGDLAFAFMGLGTMLWSPALVRRGLVGRLAGAVGLIAGVATIAVIFWQPSLDMGALLGIVFGELCFNLLTGILLFKGGDFENERRLISTPA